MSIFVSSHVLSEVEQMCEKVTIINKGRIVLTDTIKDIKKLYSVKNNYFILDTSANALMLKELERFEFISDLKIDEEDDKIHFFGSDEEKIQEAIPKILVEKNIRLKSFFQPESSLQEIFVNLIEKEGK
jgi:ABC-2 type transport system ATP-binding protein